MDADQEIYGLEVAPDQPAGSVVSRHAGFPNAADNAPGLSLDFNRLLIRHAQGTFVFRVRGDEWNKFGIFDGDIAVVDRLLDPRSSDLVIHWFDNNFVLSRRQTLPKGSQLWGTITAIIHQYRGILRS
jgi:SOS-response transcriptional repressor LexA